MAVDMKHCSGGAQPPTWFRRSMNPRPFNLTSRSPSCSHWNIHWSPKRLKYSSPRLTKEDGLLYVEVDPMGSYSWKLDTIVELLKGGAVGVIPTDTVIKDVEPSKYTFILTASKDLPKHCIRYGTTTSKYASRKNVGVRIPDYAVCQKILEKMEAPLISTCVRSTKENEWILDPVLIADVYGPEGLDFVVAAGSRVSDPSTVCGHDRGSA